jgi:chitin disaccharide deacetylase
MTKFLIVNADDFGYSHSTNKGIIEAHVNGIVTSTSVMVDSVAADEAKDLLQYKDLSVGLHFELKEVRDVEAELHKQIEKFITIVGRHPDHIDTHKRHTTDDGIQEVLGAYANTNNVPIRGFGNARYIRSFGIHSNDTSVEQLKKSIDEATDDYNELMTHVGYVDDYLKEHSSYSTSRERELAAVCDPSIKQYLVEKDIQLINWTQVKVSS